MSAAYLSALEHGRRGTPTWLLLQRIINYMVAQGFAIGRPKRVASGAQNY